MTETGITKNDTKKHELESKASKIFSRFMKTLMKRSILAIPGEGEEEEEVPKPGYTQELRV